MYHCNICLFAFFPCQRPIFIWGHLFLTSLFFPHENELLCPVHSSRKTLEHRKWTRSKVNLWIYMEQEMLQGWYNNNWYRECWYFAIWKKNKTPRRNGNKAPWWLCKCPASARTDSSVGTWMKSCKPLMPKEQSRRAGWNPHRLGNLPDISFKKICQGVYCITGKTVEWSDFSWKWSA